MQTKSHITCIIWILRDDHIWLVSLKIIGFIIYDRDGIREKGSLIMNYILQIAIQAAIIIWDWNHRDFVLWIGTGGFPQRFQTVP